MKTTRKVLTFLLALALLFSTASAVYADSSDVKVSVGGKSVTFSSDLGSPFINEDSRTLVPFRAVANFMSGVEVDWDRDAREAMFEKGDLPVVVSGQTYFLYYQVRFPIDTDQVWESFSLYNANGNIVSSHDRLSTMDTQAVIQNSRTYAPIRYLAEAFLYQVGWDNDARTVLLNPSAESTWATDMLQKEAARGNAVRTQAEAVLYAKEFARKCLHDPDTPIRFTGQKTNYLEGETGVTGWVFELDQYSSDEVYVNSLGEIWYWDQEDAVFDLWY